MAMTIVDFSLAKIFLCHCHSLSLASVKSRLVLPFWYRLTWVVPDKGPLNGCVCNTILFHAIGRGRRIDWLLIVICIQSRREKSINRTPQQGRYNKCFFLTVFRCQLINSIDTNVTRRYVYDECVCVLHWLRRLRSLAVACVGWNVWPRSQAKFISHRFTVYSHVFDVVYVFIQEHQN